MQVQSRVRIIEEWKLTGLFLQAHVDSHKDDRDERQISEDNSWYDDVHLVVDGMTFTHVTKIETKDDYDDDDDDDDDDDNDNDDYDTKGANLYRLQR